MVSHSHLSLASLLLLCVCACSMHHLVKLTHIQGSGNGLQSTASLLLLNSCLFKWFVRTCLLCMLCAIRDCQLRSLGAMLSCPGATPKHISQGAIRNLITTLNCSLSASLPLSVHFHYFPHFLALPALSPSLPPNLTFGSLSLLLSLAALFRLFCACWFGRNARWCCCVRVIIFWGKKGLPNVSRLFPTSIVLYRK